MKLSLKSKIISFLILIICLTGCNVSKSSKNTVVIPFAMDCPFSIERPVFKILVSNKKYKIPKTELLVTFDTGASVSRVLDSGIEKIWGSFEKFNNDWAYPIYEINKNDKQSFIDFYESNTILFKHWTVFFNNNQIGKNSMFHCERFLNIKTDMLLGYDFFSKNYKNIIIDYRNNEIILNAPYINDIPISMEKGFGDVYLIPITINGIDDVGIIDTGCNGFLIRKDFGTKRIAPLDEDKIMEYITSGNYKKVPLQEKDIHVEELTIGNIHYESLFAYQYNDKRLTQGQGCVEIAKYINLLGNYIWKGHRIQLDFEHNEFRID